MTPRRYLASTLSVDNRPAEHAESLQDEVTALRQARRELLAEVEKLKREIAELRKGEA